MYQDFNLFVPERAVPLHAFLVNCGHCRVTRNYRWNGLERGDRELVIWQYTLSGRGRLSRNGEVYDLLPGDAMLLTVPDAHCYELPDDSPEWEFLFLTLYGSEILRLSRFLLEKSGPVLREKETSGILPLAWEIYEWCSQQKRWDAFAVSSYAYKFQMLLLSIVLNGQEHDNRPQFVSRVTEYCLNHIAEDITVDTMAAISGYSRFHFSRRFKEETNRTPRQYLTELRLHMALRMLQTEMLSVKEIADRCGFPDVSYFCRLFKQYRSVTPEQFRKKSKKNEKKSESEEKKVAFF